MYLNIFQGKPSEEHVYRCMKALHKFCTIGKQIKLLNYCNTFSRYKLEKLLDLHRWLNTLFRKNFWEVRGGYNMLEKFTLILSRGHDVPQSWALRLLHVVVTHPRLSSWSFQVVMTCPRWALWLSQEVVMHHSGCYICVSWSLHAPASHHNWFRRSWHTWTTVTMIVLGDRDVPQLVTLIGWGREIRERRSL